MHIGNFLACRQTRTDFFYLMFAHAVHEKIRAAVHENRRANSVVPVIVMCKSTQGSLKSANCYRNIAKILTEFLTINDDCAVGTFSCNSARGILVLRTLSLGRRIVRDH